MSNLVLLSENPSFIVVFTSLALFLLFLGFVGFHLLQKINRLETDIKTIRSDVNHVGDGLLKFGVRWDEWTTNFQKFDSRHDQMVAMLEQVKFEQEILSKAIGSENKLSKAIEFARAGSSVDDIVQKVGISADEAKAIAKFHGPGETD